MKPPAIVLVRPQLGENIGAVARAMANFGLKDLRLVAPKNGWPNARAYDMAVGASPLLDAAQVFDSVPEAVAGMHVVHASTARVRDLAKPVLEPAVSAAELHRASANGLECALLFGAERTGLENEELMLADAVVTIPTAEYASLNLAQAVVVLGYAWLSAVSATPSLALPLTGGGDIPAPASKEVLEAFFRQLEQWLDAANYWRVEDKKPLMWQNLRTIFLRARMSEQEVQSMRGVFRAFAGRHSRQ